MERQVSSVALIGSFRQRYPEVLESLSAFADVGLAVTTPQGTPIVGPGIPFVRFESDPDEWSDEMVQVVALHRILRADFVFAVVPDGYVGRTTCYEIGRVIQAQSSIYFSERPSDLPLAVPEPHVVSARSIADEIRCGVFQPRPLHYDTSGQVFELEQELLNGQYHDI